MVFDCHGWKLGLTNIEINIHPFSKELLNTISHVNLKAIENANLPRKLHKLDASIIHEVKSIHIFRVLHIGATGIRRLRLQKARYHRSKTKNISVPSGLSFFSSHSLFAFMDKNEATGIASQKKRMKQIA